LNVLWLYFSFGFILLLMCTYISMYLFHILVHVALRQVLEEFSWLFPTMKPFLQAHQVYSSKWLWIKYSQLTIGISFMIRALLFGIELAYSHILSFRLFIGLMEINPIFLPMSLCISLVLGINSFYYEYSFGLVVIVRS
jgi:hypothetical protein